MTQQFHHRAFPQEKWNQVSTGSLTCKCLQQDYSYQLKTEENQNWKEQIVICLCNGILPTNKKEGAIDTYYDRDEFQKNIAK